MTLIRLASLIGVGMLVLVVNVAMSVLYMVVYGHLVNPGHPKAFYDEHIKVAAPYCSIVAGVPLMFLAGWWVARWGGPEAGTHLGINAALVVWVAYVAIDLAMVLAISAKEQLGAKMWMLVAASILTKLGAVCAGAMMRGSCASDIQAT